MASKNSGTNLLLGLFIGLLGGFFLGAFFGKSVFQLASLLAHMVSKGRSDEERMKFELLLQ